MILSIHWSHFCTEPEQSAFSLFDFILVWSQMAFAAWSFVCFLYKKKLAKENRRLELKCFFTQVTSSTEIVQLSAQSSSWCPCQKTARKMTKRPKKATAASMVTTIYYSDGFWQWSFFWFLGLGVCELLQKKKHCWSCTQPISRVPGKIL